MPGPGMLAALVSRPLLSKRIRRKERDSNGREEKAGRGLTVLPECNPGALWAQEHCGFGAVWDGADKMTVGRLLPIDLWRAFVYIKLA
jgi:hypothetical protein